MGGVGVLTWLAIGSAVGWVISRLMVGPDDDALRGTAAGMVGGLLGGLAMRLVESPPGLGSPPLNTLIAVLGGSLWLTWITCVVTSGRERGSNPPPRQVHFVSTGPARRARIASRPTYAAARDELVDQLLRDAMAHDAGRYEDVGKHFESLGREVPQGAGLELARLRLAMAFWGAWIDARDRGWQSRGGIAKADWPLFARTVAADLDGDRNVSDPRLVPRFEPHWASSLGDRVQSVVTRMRVS